MGAALFKHRLAVIVGFFLASVLVAFGASRVVDVPGRTTLTDLFTLERVFVPAGALCLLAFALRTWGEAQLGAAVYSQGAAPRVVTSGPFRFLRHPLYAGTWLFFVAAVAPYVPWVFLVAAALAFAAALRAIAIHEEAHLAERHGDAWRRYAAAVPRFVGRPGPVERDDIAADRRAWAAGALSNVGMAALGSYRLVVGTGHGFTGLRALTVLLLGAWLLVVIVRRVRQR